MSKFPRDDGRTRKSFISSLVTIFASCLALSYFRPDVLGPVPVQLTFLALGWGAGWFLNRVVLMLLVMASTAVGLILLLDRWGDPSLEFLSNFSHALLPISAMCVIAASLRKMTEHFEVIAGQDSLTGLFNQKQFVKLVEKRIRLAPGSSRHIAIAFMDCVFLSSIHSM